MKRSSKMVIVIAIITASAAGCGLTDDHNESQSAAQLTATTNTGSFVLSLSTETAPQDKVVVTSSDGTPSRDCFGACQFAYLAGATLTLRVPFPTDTPNCIRFDGWDGACAGQWTTCVIQLNSDLSTTALWAPIIGCDPA
jgi:hypothetical protein